MNFTLISAILTELPQIIQLVQELVAAGKGVPEVQNAVQGHELVRNAHPDIRSALNTVVAHVVDEIKNKPAASEDTINPQQNEPAAENTFILPLPSLK